MAFPGDAPGVISLPVPASLLPPRPSLPQQAPKSPSHIPPALSACSQSGPSGRRTVCLH